MTALTNGRWHPPEQPHSEAIVESTIPPNVTLDQARKRRAAARK